MLSSWDYSDINTTQHLNSGKKPLKLRKLYQNRISTYYQITILVGNLYSTSLALSTIRIDRQVCRNNNCFTLK